MKKLTPDQAEKIQRRKKELEQNNTRKTKTDNKPVKASKPIKAYKTPLKDKNPLKTSVNALQDPVNDNTTVNIRDNEDVSIQDIENRIMTAVYTFLSENNLDEESMKKERQYTWNALCMYVGMNVFKHTKLLRDKNLSFTGCLDTNCNRVDLDKVVYILSNIYDYLLLLYNKTFSTWSASLFLGLQENYILYHAEELTALGYDVTAKRETALQDNISDGRINPTGSIAILNNKFSWGQDNTRNITNNIESVVVYPSLQMNGHNNDIKAIPEKP